MNVEYSRMFLKDIQKITDKNLKLEIKYAIENFENATHLNQISSIKKNTCELFIF